VSFLSDSRRVTRALSDFYHRSLSAEGRVVTQAPIEDIIERLDLAGLASRGGLSGAKLSEFLDAYLSYTTRLHHPEYLAHQVAAPHPSGGLAALVDGVTNNAMAIYEMGPAAAAIEFFVINWLLGKIGWIPTPHPRETGCVPEHGGGVLTHGGSLANLTALLAARSRIAPDVWDQGNPGDLAVLAPAESHYSIARAIGIMGLGRRALYPLPVDDAGRVLADRIPQALAKVREDGRRAMALVANACSTGVGLYDPLREIGQACREAGVWMHVDGAHGASALLSDRHRALLDGADMADSLVWDAHKLMRAPTLCAAVLVRDAATLDRAFEQEASYLFHDKAQPGVDFIHRTVECTKAGLGLRFFAVLGALGEQGLGHYIERQYGLAAEAFRLIRAQEDFDCPVEPQSNILCFRVRGTDAAQIAIRDALIAQGRFHLSTVFFGGRRYLRATFMSPATTLADVSRLIEAVRTEASRVEAGGAGTAAEAKAGRPATPGGHP